MSRDNFFIAAKALLTHLCQRSSVEQTVAASHGYDIPQFAKLNDFKIWEQVGPPTGTVFNYPIRAVSGQKPSLDVTGLPRTLLTTFQLAGSSTRRAHTC